MMSELQQGQRAFSTFRVLQGDGKPSERDQLFRSMAQLFSYVSDRCDDEQVAQYDDVLCQLAGMVEVEARVHVAKLLAPLDRAPGTVVVKLANDVLEVARPLLEFSNVLSDDDLIDIVTNKSEDHRVAIAGRASVAGRVGEAIVHHGDTSSVTQLVRNPRAELGHTTLQKLMELASGDSAIASDLRGRGDIDWASLRGEIDEVAGKVLETIASNRAALDPVVAGKINAVVYNRIRNGAGFSANEWKLAYNQVKALSDRKQLDERALARFVRFGYGHHAAAGASVLLRVAPETFVKWLATQDYAAMTVALRAAGFGANLFSAVLAMMPWRDLPTDDDCRNVVARFNALSQDEAADIFDLWRAHSFRKRVSSAAHTGSAQAAY